MPPPHYVIRQQLNHYLIGSNLQPYPTQGHHPTLPFFHAMPEPKEPAKAASDWAKAFVYCKINTHSPDPSHNTHSPCSGTLNPQTPSEHFKGATHSDHSIAVPFSPNIIGDVRSQSSSSPGQLIRKPVHNRSEHLLW